MLLKRLIPLYILLLLLTSCKKNKKTSESTTSTPNNPVVTPVTTIDSTDTRVQITRYDPILITTTDVDLDKDGTADVRINITNNFSAGGNTQLETQMQTLKANTFLLCDSVYTQLNADGCNNSSTNTQINQLYIKALAYKDTLKSNDRWRSDTIHVFNYQQIWVIQSGPNACYTFTQSLNWPSNEYRYIGVMVNGHPGWIKIYFDGFHPKIYGFAIQK